MHINFHREYIYLADPSADNAFSGTWIHTVGGPCLTFRRRLLAMKFNPQRSFANWADSDSEEIVLCQESTVSNKRECAASYLADLVAGFCCQYSAICFSCLSVNDLVVPTQRHLWTPQPKRASESSQYTPAPTTTATRNPSWSSITDGPLVTVDGRTIPRQTPLIPHLRCSVVALSTFFCSIEKDMYCISHLSFIHGNESNIVAAAVVVGGGFI